MTRMLDPPALVRAMTLYAQALEDFRDEIDSLNVFPVPDGDTGTNLLQTQRAVVGALSEAGVGREDAVPDMAGVAGTISHSALTGARGNSGVILSQLLRAFCAGLPAAGADAPSVARALTEAARAARRAVAEPKEGTVLTVLDAAAAAAGDAAAPDADDGDVLGAALAGAREALGRTPLLLPELGAAGVVDAGGKGAVLLLDALHAAVIGGDVTERAGPAGPVGRETAGRPNATPLTYPYEVEFLLEDAGDGTLSELRVTLAAMGDSLAIVGGGDLYRIHVHTDRPDDVLAVASARGTVLEAATTSLEEQVADCLGRAARGVQAGTAPAHAVTAAAADRHHTASACVLVAVLEPSEVADAVRSLGAVVVEPADDDACTVERIRGALGSGPSGGAVILVEAAGIRRAPEAADWAGDVAVLSSPSLPAAISAAAEFHPDAAPAENLAAMSAAAERTRTADLAAPAASPEATAIAVADLVAQLEALEPNAEVLTVVVGTDIPREGLTAVRTTLAQRFPALRIETLRGAGPSPAYQVGLE